MPTSNRNRQRGKRGGSSEFFYMKGGKRQDAALHEPILREGDKDSAFAVTREMLRQAGWTDEQIAGFAFAED